MIAKPISIKDAERKFGGCARKALELIEGDLLHVSDSRLRAKQFPLTLQQKSAAGVVCAEQRVVREG
jgi:hypothetical protein